MPVTASSTSRFRNQILVGSTGVVLAGLLALAIRGSIIAQGNFVCDSGRNPTCGFISGIHAILIPVIAEVTGTGGKIGTANPPRSYDTILAANPFDSDASTRGLRTGSSATLLAKLDIIANPDGASFDCGVVKGTKSFTGSAVINNVHASGSINISNTPFTMGPTDDFACKTLMDTSRFEGTLTLLMMDSDVVN